MREAATGISDGAELGLIPYATKLIDYCGAIAEQTNSTAVIQEIVRCLILLAKAQEAIYLDVTGDEPRVLAQGRSDSSLVSVVSSQCVLPDPNFHRVIQRLGTNSRSTLLQTSTEVFGGTTKNIVVYIPLLMRGILMGVVQLIGSPIAIDLSLTTVNEIGLLAKIGACALSNAHSAEEVSASREDVSAEARLRQELDESQRMTKAGTWYRNFRTDIESWSAETYKIFEVDPMVTPSYALFLSRVHPDDRDDLDRKIMTGARASREIPMEYRIVVPSGATKHLRTTGKRVITPDGDLTYFGVVADVTEMYLSEERIRSTRSELTRVGRLTSLGELAGLILQEMTQPLTGIALTANAGTRWLNRDDPKIERASNCFAKIVRDGHRAAEILQMLRILVAKSNPQKEIFELSIAIKEALVSAEREFKSHRVSLNARLDDSLTVLADRVQLQELVMHLVTNSLEAMGSLKEKRRILELTCSAASSSLAELTVSDTGVGVLPGTEEMISRPFFTTKKNALGMGLPICNSIVESHQGSLAIFPNIGGGTVVKILLPIV